MSTTCSARISTRWSPGRGSGAREHAATLVGAVLASDWPCVLDADALNLLADDKNLRNACARRKADTLLTPHPAEAGAFSSSTTREVQADRLAAARSLAEPKRARGAQGKRQHPRRARRPSVHQHHRQSRHGERRDGRRALGNPRRAARAAATPASRRWCWACTCMAPRPTRWQPMASARSASPRAK